LKLTESLEVELIKMSVISTKLEWAKVIVLIIRRIYIYRWHSRGYVPHLRLDETDTLED
jgi:hypothetical protein